MNERRARWILAVAVLAAVLRAGEAQAQMTPALSYLAPSECPTREHFGAEVAARLGRAAFSPEADETMGVEILEGAEGWVATLSLGSPSMRAFRDPDCAALVRTVATAATVLLDGSASPPSEQPERVEEDPGPRQPSPVAPERASEVATPPPPPVAARDDEARVRVTAERPGLTLHVGRRTSAPGGMMGGTTEFERVCTAPCETRLEPGMHHFAVSEGVRTAVPLDELVPISGDSRVSLHYEDDAPSRWAGGALLLAGGIVLGAAVFWTLYLTEREEDPVVTGPLVLAGAGLAGYVAGFVLLLDGDDVAVRVDGPL